MPKRRSIKAVNRYLNYFSRFREDAVFQRARTSLGEGSSTPDFGKLQIAIAPPDSTYFFAAWRELAPNEAAFCKGYLGSEMIEEYLFGRKDSQSPWMLIDYFRADDAISDGVVVPAIGCATTRVD